MDEQTKMIMQAIAELREEVQKGFAENDERFNEVTDKVDLINARLDHQVLKLGKLEEEQSILKNFKRV